MKYYERQNLFSLCQKDGDKNDYERNTINSYSEFKTYLNIQKMIIPVCKTKTTPK